MPSIFAQIIDTPSIVRTSVDAAELAKQVGPVWFFAILCFVASVILIIGIGWMAYKFGGKFLERLEKFLDNLQTALVYNAEAIKVQTLIGSNTRSNVSNLVDAGNSFANITEKFGKEFGIDVTHDVEKIHDKLRTMSPN